MLESVGDAVDPASSGPVRPVSACWVGRVLRDAHIRVHRVHRVRGWLHRIPEALFDARIAAIGTSPFWSANALPTLRERGHGVREIARRLAALRRQSAGSCVAICGRTTAVSTTVTWHMPAPVAGCAGCGARC